MKRDITADYHGSIVLFTGNTSEGEQWLASRLSPDTMRFGSAYAAEVNYSAAIVEGAENDGLTVDRL